MSTTTNRSFWQDKTGVPGTIREAPIPSTLVEDEIFVKVRAWGLNPVDAFIQDHPLPFFKYPLIPGQDIAGTVERVGPGPHSQRFKVGDRVLGYAMGASAMGKPGNGAFQDYVVLDHALAVKIPDSLSFAEAAVFPLCLATAGHALFGSKYLALPPPKAASGSAPRTGKSVLIWGGASAVGSNAIQLARAAGFEVLATCSPRNFDYVLGLGADKVFDYNSATVVDDLVTELDNKGVCAGIFQAAGMTGDAVAPCCQVSHRLRQKPFVACANVVPEGAVPEGVEAKFVFGGEDGRGIYYDTTSQLFGGFLEEALRLGTYKAAPRPEVVRTRGLEGIQEGLDVVKKGVSAKKIVVLAE
ncbi:GroES-like protein [Daldinia vernicosa]|uniref:GroES-like protein n=1 Tax=Daldinia vernicosa TaxID=114800 RepID=UPI002008B3BB|nr:GroES-like protein [Daldinia vernicosa]KAI0847438.1 GroES-like protein [Daldinia vernicosa]